MTNKETLEELVLEKRVLQQTLKEHQAILAVVCLEIMDSKGIVRVPKPTMDRLPEVEGIDFKLLKAGSLKLTVRLNATG